MTRLVDRGAVTAAYVGIGVAVTVGVSFLLVIPIEPIFWLLTVPSGLLIGYYANARANRPSGPWLRIVANGLFAGIVTGLTFALLLLAVKALFFYADSGYRDPGFGGPLDCETGPPCVYERYLADGRGDALVGAGVSDVESFTAFYWTQQLTTAAVVLGLTTLGAIGGALVYGAAGPKPRPDATEGGTAAG